MQTFVLTEEGKKQVRFNILRVVPLIAMAEFIAIALFYMTMPAPSMDIFLFVVLILLSTSSITLFIIGRASIKSSESMRLTLDNDRLVCDRVDRPQIIINRTNVRRIVDLEGKGIRIEPTDRTSMLFVPIGLQNYEEFKLAILGWTPSTQESKLLTLQTIYIVVVFLLIVAMNLTNIPILKLLSIVLLVVFVIVIYVRNMKRLWSKKKEMGKV
ncbi:MAG: hypothetical protein ABR936_16765 [Bacteroidota bacterium]|jgi:hypothetical protein